MVRRALALADARWQRRLQHPRAEHRETAQKRCRRRLGPWSCGLRVLTKQQRPKRITKQECMRLLTRHIKQNTWQVGFAQGRTDTSSAPSCTVNVRGSLKAQ